MHKLLNKEEVRTILKAREIDKEKHGIEKKKAAKTEITQFRIFSRVRPYIEEEISAMNGEEMRSIVEMFGNRTILLDPSDKWLAKGQFEFDASLWSIPSSTGLVHTFHDTQNQAFQSQEDVYNLVAGNCVEDAFNFINSCILGYGMTGSGKTYTMMGKYNSERGSDSSEEGIIPRLCNDLFKRLVLFQEEQLDKPEGDRIKCTVQVNFIEIYMEQVRDLLDVNLKTKRYGHMIFNQENSNTGNIGSLEGMKEGKVRMDPQSGPFIENVTVYEVNSWEDCRVLLERGSKMRTTGITSVHNQSSRSHAIFQVTLMQQTTKPAVNKFSEPVVSTRAARINLVDLAGSERGGMTNYVKESSMINKSLLALRRVIDHLVKKQAAILEYTQKEIERENNLNKGGYNDPISLPYEIQHMAVPYRDSVLTWLLSDSIGGNARTTMIATLSPLAKNYNDTLATLQWCSKARSLVTVVKTNDPLSTISTSIASKTNEIQGTLFIQKQNVENIREKLVNLGELITKTQAEIKFMIEAVEKMGHKKIETVEKMYQFKCMFIIFKYIHKKRISSLGKKLEDTEKKLQDAKLEFDEISKQDLKLECVLLKQKLNDMNAKIVENAALFVSYTKNEEAQAQTLNEWRMETKVERGIINDVNVAHASKYEPLKKAYNALKDEMDSYTQKNEQLRAECTSNVDLTELLQLKKTIEKNQAEIAQLTQMKEEKLKQIKALKA